MGKSKKELKRKDWAEDRQPWDRQPRETQKAYEAFMVYVRLPYETIAGVATGVTRSEREVGRKLGKSHTLINRWARQWGWTPRADAYDLEMQRVEHEERKQKHRAWIRKAEGNLSGVRDEAHEIYQLLFERAKAMLESPLYITTEEVEETDTGEVVVRTVMPAGWNFSTIPRLVQAMIQMAAITTATGGDWDALVKLIDYEALTDEQIERIAGANGPEEIISALIGKGTP